MFRFTRSEPNHDDWQGSTVLKNGTQTQKILIPLKGENSNYITGFVVLDDSDLPEEGQSTLLDYVGSNFRESFANLTIHRELGDPILENGYTKTLLKLAYAIDHTNILSHNHAVKTALWARKIAERLGFTEEQSDQIELASKLHDVGKVVVPKSVLVKPAPLSEEEWKIMHQHPTFGAMIMKPSHRLYPLIPFVKAHHEHFDGSGYPLGLAGEQIPLQARIMGVADAYSTITEPRVYRQAGTRLEALQELERWSGKQFDPEIVSVMIELTTSGQVDDSQCAWEPI